MSDKHARKLGSGPTRGDYHGAWNFEMTIDGFSAGNFQKIDGLSMDMELVTYQDGDDLIERKRAGRMKVGNIKCTRGYINDSNMRDWLKATREGKEDRRSVEIILKGHVGERICSWTLFETWPKGWKITGFDGKGNNTLNEEIEFVCEDWTFNA